MVNAHAGIIQLPTHATIRAMRARKRRTRAAILAALLAAIVAFTIGRVSVRPSHVCAFTRTTEDIGWTDGARTYDYLPRCTP